jgi:hypothetical protein
VTAPFLAAAGGFPICHAATRLLWFVPAMLTGMLLHRILARR